MSTRDGKVEHVILIIRCMRIIKILVASSYMVLSMVTHGHHLLICSSQGNILLKAMVWCYFVYAACDPYWTGDLRVSSSLDMFVPSFPKCKCYTMQTKI